MEVTTQMKRRRLLLACVLFFTMVTSMALPDDKNQPLHVIADSGIFNYTQGISNLEGNVTVTQGSTTLSGHKMMIYTDKNQQLVQLIAHGDAQKQASYETLPSSKDSPFHATADRITYINAQKCVIFEGNTRATDGMNEFTGPKFKYFTDEQKVVTEGNANQPSSIIIYPGKKH